MMGTRSLLYVLLLMLIAHSTIAQEFRFSAALPSIHTNGFYKIPLSSQILSRLKTDQSDLRLIDNKSREIPFILRSKTSSLSNRSSTKFHIPATQRDSTNTSHDIEPGLSLQIRNENGGPLNISKARVFDEIDLTEEKWIENAPLLFKQSDSCNGYSYVFIHNPRRFLIQKLDFEFAGPGIHGRQANLFELSPNGRVVQYVSSAKLVSGEPVSIRVFPLRHERLLLEIENKNNPPLQIQQVKSSHPDYYLFAYLNSQQEYKLVFGNTEFEAPDKDFELSFASIPSSVEILIPGPIQEFDDDTAKTYKWKDILPWIVFPSLALVAAFIWRILKLKRKMNVFKDFNQSR